MTTHPLVTDALLVRAFGDVHILSHLTGAANWADAKRLQSLERDLAETKRSLASQATEQRQAAERHQREIAGLECRLRAAEASAAALATTETRLREFENGEAYRTLEHANDALTAELRDARRSCG